MADEQKDAEREWPDIRAWVSERHPEILAEYERRANPAKSDAALTISRASSSHDEDYVVVRLAQNGRAIVAEINLKHFALAVTGYAFQPCRVTRNEFSDETNRVLAQLGVADTSKELEAMVDRLLHDAEHKDSGAQMAGMMRDEVSRRRLMSEAHNLRAEALALDPKRRCRAWTA